MLVERVALVGRSARAERLYADGGRSVCSGRRGLRVVWRVRDCGPMLADRAAWLRRIAQAWI
jgi:hypothetical protein